MSYLDELYKQLDYFDDEEGEEEGEDLVGEMTRREMLELQIEAIDSMGFPNVHLILASLQYLLDTLEYGIDHESADYQTEVAKKRIEELKSVL